MRSKPHRTHKKSIKKKPRKYAVLRIYVAYATFAWTWL